jgi:hypothetical protein
MIVFLRFGNTESPSKLHNWLVSWKEQALACEKAGRVMMEWVKLAKHASI